MGAGSLVVRVSADINDFTRNLKKMTGDVTKAADTIGNIGKKMTLGITVPAALAAFALAKMGAENEQVGRKMQRVFGDNADSAQAFIDTIMKSVPETGTELQKMAINLTEVGDDLGFAAKQSQQFSEGVLTIAARIATTKMVPFAEAVDAVQKSMMGQTKGLKQLGIVLSETDIKNEAYRLGLIKSGQQLNAHGTALAAYSLMLAKTNKMTSEAGVTQQDLATKMAFVKRDFSELADATSNLVLPALSLLVDGLRMLVDMLTSIPEGVRTVILLVIALAAAIGPLLIVTTSLVKAFTTLRAAIALLTAAEGVGGFLALLAAPEVLAALLAIAAVLGITAAAWKKYHKEAAKPTPLPTPPSVKSLLGGSPTSVQVAVDPLQEFQKRSAAVMQAFAQTAEMGRPLTGIFDQVNALNKEALTLYDQQKDKLGEVALAAQDVANRTASIIAIQSVANQLYQSKGLLNSAVGKASRTADPQQSISNNLASQKIQYETSLRVRESWLRATDTFQATREAMISFKESVVNAGHNFSETIASVKAQYSSLGNAGSAAMGALKESAAGLIKEFSIWQLILKIISEILSGIGPQIGAIFSLFKVMGEQLGYVLAPVFKLLYNVIRGVIIVFTMLSELIVRFTANLLTGMGKFMNAIGNLINKISPGSPGNPLKKIGDALEEYGRSQYRLADKLYKTEMDLRKTDWEDALNGVDALGDAANTAASALLNFPASFKYALRHYNASAPDEVDPSIFNRRWPSMPSGGRVDRPLPQMTQINVQVAGRTIASVVLGELRTQAKQQFNDASRFTELSTVR